MKKSELALGEFLNIKKKSEIRINKTNKTK